MPTHQRGRAQGTGGEGAWRRPTSASRAADQEIARRIEWFKNRILRLSRVVMQRRQ